MRDVEEAVLQFDLLLIYATRQNCPECRQLDRRMQRLSRRFPNVKAFHIDLDTMPYAASRYLIYEVPTALLYYRGKPTVKRVGVLDIRELSELLSLMNEHASSAADDSTRS